MDMTGSVGKSRSERPRRVLLANPDPRSMLASFLALITEPLDIALIDPGTPGVEVQRIVDLLKPDRIQVADDPPPERRMDPVNLAIAPKLARILIPTGGTTGNPRPIAGTTLDGRTANTVPVF